MWFRKRKYLDVQLECLYEAIEDLIDSNIALLKENARLQKKADKLLKHLGKNKRS